MVAGGWAPVTGGIVVIAGAWAPAIGGIIVIAGALGPGCTVTLVPSPKVVAVWPAGTGPFAIQ